MTGNLRWRASIERESRLCVVKSIRSRVPTRQGKVLSVVIGVHLTQVDPVDPV